MEQLHKELELGLDTETFGLEFNDRLFSVQIATANEEYYFNYLDYGDGTPVLHKSTLMDLGTLCKNSSILWYIHNAKFDLRRLALEGIRIQGPVHCSQMCERFMYNQHQSYSLDACAKRRGRAKDDAVGNYIKDNKLWEWQEKVGKKTRTKKKFFDKVPFDIMFKYGCIDVREAFDLGREQRQELKGEEYYENSLELEKVCYEMEELGIQVRREYAGQGYAYEIEQARIETEELERLSGEPYRSGPLWLRRQFDKFGVEYQVNPKTDNPIFDKKALGKIDHPIAGHIRKRRTHEKYAGTYYATYSEQEVIHAFIKTWGTDTGRFSYAEPNLQNVPKEEELHSDIPFQVRGCFRPRDGYCFVMVDFDQQEFRLLLDYAGEHDLIRRINDHGEDVHQATADMVGVSRKMAKTLNFGLLYGMGAEKLAQSLGVPVLQAKTIKRQYFARLPNVQRLIRQVIQTAERRKYIRTWVGRKLHFPNRDFAYKAPNHLIQGGCGDIARHAMVRIHGDVLEGLRSNMLLQVHDELLFEVHKDELDIIPAIVNIMENTYRPFNGMKLTCGVEHSYTSWGKRDVKEGYPN